LLAEGITGEVVVPAFTFPATANAIVLAGATPVFVDIEDAMSAYWLTATNGRIGEIYNIGGNKIISVKNFLKELIRNSSVKIKTKLDKRLLRPQDVTLQIPSVDKFKKDTKWKQKNSFKVSVINLLNECRKKNTYE